MDELNVGGSEPSVNLETNQEPISNDTGSVNVDSGNTPEVGGGEPNSNDSQSNGKPKQDRETNLAFQQMRETMEQQKRDYEVARRYGAHGIYSEADIAANYGNQGITTLAQLEDAIRAEQEAQQMNVPVELYKTVQDMNKRLQAYESKEQMQAHDQMLSNDPRLGKIYTKVKDEAYNMAKQYNVDLRTGFNLALEARAHELFVEPDYESLKKQAVQEYINGIKSNNAPVEGSTNGGAVVHNNGKPKTFREADKQAIEYIRNALKP